MGSNNTGQNLKPEKQVSQTIRLIFNLLGKTHVMTSIFARRCPLMEESTVSKINNQLTENPLSLNFKPQKSASSIISFELQTLFFSVILQYKGVTLFQQFKQVSLISFVQWLTKQGTVNWKPKSESSFSSVSRLNTFDGYPKFYFHVCYL